MLTYKNTINNGIGQISFSVYNDIEIFLLRNFLNNPSTKFWP